MSASAPKLRPAADDDDAFLDALYATTRDREMGALPWPAEVKDGFLRMQSRAQRADYRRRHPGAEAMIIELEGQAIGRFHVDRSGAEIRVIDISLLPEHRGRGIGGRLLTALLDEARSRDRRVWLTVELSNPARRLYERLGFEPREEDGVYCSMVWPGAAPADVRGVST